MNRRSFAAISGLGLLVLMQSESINARSAVKRRSAAVYEATFLKALPEQKKNLAEFIRAKWFAMDAVAHERGLMSSYQLVENQDENADWDLLVMVGYPHPDGYAHIRAEFEKIRKAHVNSAIDGKSLAQLGKILRSERWKPLAGNG